MAYLFIVEDKMVTPTPEVLLVSPFKEIWERDTSKGKELAMREFAYIEFMTSALKSNPYRGYNESQRPIVIKREVIKDTSWEPDSLITEGMGMILKLQTEGSKNFTLYKSAVAAVEKLESFFNTFNLNEKMRNGAPVYKPRDITNAVQDLDKAMSSLSSLEKKVEEDLFDVVKIRGAKEISPFAKPEILTSIKN